MPLLLVYYLSNCLLVTTDKNNGWDFKNSRVKVALSLKYSLWGDSLSWKSLIWGGTATTPAPEAVGLIVVCGKAGALMETSTKQLSHYRPAKLSAECEPTMRKCFSSVALVPIVWGSPGLFMPFADKFKHVCAWVQAWTSETQSSPIVKLCWGKEVLVSILP